MPWVTTCNTICSTIARYVFVMYCAALYRCRYFDKTHHTDIWKYFPELCTRTTPYGTHYLLGSSSILPQLVVCKLIKHSLLLEFRNVREKPSFSVFLFFSFLFLEIDRDKATLLSQSKIKQIVVVVGPALSPADDDLLLLLLVGHGVEELLELLLGHFLSQLARLRQHDQSVLHLGRARFLDHPDATQSVHGLGVQDLVQDAGSCFGCVVPTRRVRQKFSPLIKRGLVA